MLKIVSILFDSDHIIAVFLQLPHVEASIASKTTDVEISLDDHDAIIDRCIEVAIANED